MDTSTNPSPADRVRDRMRRWLEIAGLTQDQFAVNIGRTQEWLQAILKGKNDPRLRDLDEIARAMRTTASELVRLSEDRYQLELTPTEVRIFEKLRRNMEFFAGVCLLLEIPPPPIDRNRMSVSHNHTIDPDSRPETQR